MASHKSALFFLCASIGPLVIAYIAQYAFAVQPCLLCLYQRIPFFLAAGVAIWGLYVESKVLRNLSFALCFLLFLLNAGLAGLHASIEYKLIKNFFPCSVRTAIFESLPDNIEEVKRQLVGDKAVLAIVDCEEAPMRLLGLSFSGWNFVYCVSAAMFSIIVRRRDQAKQ